METEPINWLQRIQEAFSPETLKLLMPQLPVNGSSHGYEIDFIIYLIHGLMAVLFIGWGIFFILALVKFNRRANPKANYKGVQNHVSSYLEVAVAVIEVILLVGFSLPFWSKQVNAYPQRDDKVEVRAVAEQFAWNFHYPGADGKFGNTDWKYFDKQTNPLGLDPDDPYGKDDITTINQLHLPIGRPAVVYITSKDVIHSFALPIMRVKQDAMPGIMVPAWFTPTKSGKSDVGCAQLCGIGHYYMKGTLTVHHEEEFQQWLAKNAVSAGGGEGGGDYDDFWN